MPTYTYENAKGEQIEAVRTIAERDLAPDGFRRVIARPAAPRAAVASHGLFTGKARDPGEAELAVPRAFKQLEQTQGADRICREAGFSARQIRGAWDF